METGNKTVSDIVTLVKSWLPTQPETANVSRDFWMPDHMCRVCYSCDSQFTLFNRRHHCRLCGRVFCSKCTSNSVPASAMNTTPPREYSERIRVCNYCFKQYEQYVAARSNALQDSDQDTSNSLSASSFITSKSALTINSGSYTLGSTPYPVGSYQRVQQSLYHGHHQSSSKLSADISGPHEEDSRRLNPSVTETTNVCSNIYGYSPNRSEDEDDEYSVCPSELEAKRLLLENSYFGPVEFNGTNDGSPSSHRDRDNTDSKSFSSSPLTYDFHSPGRDAIQQVEKKDGNDGDECEASSSLYAAAEVDAEPVDFENNGLLWLPPEPEDVDDEREGALFYDDDDGDATGEWGCMHSSSSMGSGDCNGSDRSSEEPKSARCNMVDGHFRALVAQLLQVENLPVDSEANEEGWLEIITALSWEAATLLKPDMSIGGGMDPGGYVKVKCIASGCRSESMVVKGVVCKKNIAHRRMTSKLDKPRLLILGGGLEYHRVANRLSSFDTLLKQEIDHLKVAVAKIDAHHPDVLLVEKSVSRFAQDYLLEKGIPLVLNIKKALLERIARCTGGQIVPSVDHLSSPKLGYCEKFHVERFLEDLGIDGQEGKRSIRTLMFFEGCPKPLGFTILLKGANQHELKKVKHVVQYGVFAAYHLALETSFLADEGASVPEFPSNSQIPVAFPDKTTTIQRSISTIPGFTVSANEKSQGPLGGSKPERSNSVPIEGSMLSLMKEPTQETEVGQAPPGLPRGPKPCKQPTLNQTDPIAHFSSGSPEKNIPEKISRKDSMESNEKLEVSVSNNGSNIMVDSTNANQSVSPLQDRRLSFVDNGDQNDHTSGVVATQIDLDVSSMQQECNSFPEAGTAKEEFPPSPSDQQSILVSLSSRCVWKGTVCERSHLFRIKYYGSFDKPLGRFLRDNLFDQTYRCNSCAMPAEAHIHCYTHRQGTLTISVKKLPEVLLPGEKDGKIWMWHRCLRCPRTNGFPPATRRIVMSDAAWGLSFGKFLELSFSNNAAASRVATCGHSLQRDCLRFYGFGNMVACFRYVSISVYSVFLPPSKLDFDYGNQEWIKKETGEVNDRAELLFSEIRNALQKIAEKKFGRHACDCAMEMHESMHQIAELLGMVQKEKDEFEESLQKALHKEVREMQPVIDILDINRLRRQLLFQSYVWDHRLINAASAVNSSSQDCMTCSDSETHKKLAGTEKVNEISYVSILAEPAKVPTHDTLKTDSGQGLEETCDGSVNQSHAFDHNRAMSEGANHGEEEDEASLAATQSMYDRSENIESSGSFRRVLSDGQFPVIDQLSETLDAAWTGEYNIGTTIRKYRSSSLSESAVGDLSHVATEAECVDSQESQHLAEDRTGLKVVHSPSQALSTKSENVEDAVSWIGIPFLSLYRSLNKNILANTKKLDELGDYSPVYVSSFRELELQAGSRLLLPACLNETVIPVYDDEPTSIVSYALLTPEYQCYLGDDGDRHREYGDSVTSVPASDLMHHQPSDETISTPRRNLPSADEHSMGGGSRNPLHGDPDSRTKGSHPRVSFGDDVLLGKVKYSVTFYFAKQFEALRRLCCPELDFVRSLSRCRKWGAQGGKSNVFFAKTLDDRFIVKQVTKTELESFIRCAPVYFRYLMESITTHSPTCLAKILGIYQIAIKQLKGTKESKMDVLVMENLLFRRNVVRLYDLKGSSRSRYNADSSGKNKVLLDQNLIEAMPTSPIFVGNKAKRILERAVWNDTAFLASVDVMDYSLLVGVDEEKHELVLGIIDFIRQYTWDKHLETWVKASGILGGPKNTPPTVISPKQYKKRFRKAMTTYFLMIPDQWSTCEEGGRASTEQ